MDGGGGGGGNDETADQAGTGAGAASLLSASTPRSLIASSQVTDDDVLLGRGKRSYNHEGNIRFRKIVLSRADAYRQNSNKAFRMALTLEVINRIESIGGRFLRQFDSGNDTEEESSKSFEPVARSVVKTKVKQALRDTAAGLTAAEQQAPRKTAAGMHSTRHPIVGQTNAFLNMLPNTSTIPHPLAGNLLQSQNPLLGPGIPNNEYARLLEMVALQQQLQDGQQTAAMVQALENQRAFQLSQLVEQQNRNVNLASRLTPQQQRLLGLIPVPPPMTTAPTGDRSGLGNIERNTPGDLAPLPATDQPLSLRSALYHQQIPTAGGIDPDAGSLYQQSGSGLTSGVPNMLQGPNSLPLVEQTIPNFPQQRHQLISGHPQPLRPPDLLQHRQPQEDPAFATNTLSQFMPVATAAAVAQPPRNSSSSSSSEGGGMQSIHRSLHQHKTPFKTEDDLPDEYQNAAAILALRQQQEFGLVSKPSMETVDGLVQHDEDTDDNEDDEVADSTPYV